MFVLGAVCMHLPSTPPCHELIRRHVLASLPSHEFLINPFMKTPGYHPKAPFVYNPNL